MCVKYRSALTKVGGRLGQYAGSASFGIALDPARGVKGVIEFVGRPLVRSEGGAKRC